MKIIYALSDSEDEGNDPDGQHPVDCSPRIAGVPIGEVWQTGEEKKSFGSILACSEDSEDRSVGGESNAETAELEEVRHRLSTTTRRSKDISEGGCVVISAAETAGEQASKERPVVSSMPRDPQEHRGNDPQLERTFRFAVSNCGTKILEKTTRRLMQRDLFALPCHEYLLTTVHDALHSAMLILGGPTGLRTTIRSFDKAKLCALTMGQLRHFIRSKMKLQEQTVDDKSLDALGAVLMVNMLDAVPIEDFADFVEHGLNYLWLDECLGADVAAPVEPPKMEELADADFVHFAEGLGETVPQGKQLITESVLEFLRSQAQAGHFGKIVSARVAPLELAGDDAQRVTVDLAVVRLEQSKYRVAHAVHGDGRKQKTTLTAAWRLASEHSLSMLMARVLSGWRTRVDGCLRLRRRPFNSSPSLAAAFYVDDRELEPWHSPLWEPPGSPRSGGGGPGSPTSGGGGCFGDGKNLRSSPYAAMRSDVCWMQSARHRRKYQLGDVVEVWSDASHAWRRGEIIEVADGSNVIQEACVEAGSVYVLINDNIGTCGTWVPPEEQDRDLRLFLEARPRYEPGDPVEVWMPCKRSWVCGEILQTASASTVIRNRIIAAGSIEVALLDESSQCTRWIMPEQVSESLRLVSQAQSSRHQVFVNGDGERPRTPTGNRHAALSAGRQRTVSAERHRLQCTERHSTWSAKRQRTRIATRPLTLGAERQRTPIAERQPTVSAERQLARRAVRPKTLPAGRQPTPTERRVATNGEVQRTPSQEMPLMPSADGPPMQRGQRPVTWSGVMRRTASTDILLVSGAERQRTPSTERPMEFGTEGQPTQNAERASDAGSASNTLAEQDNAASADVVRTPSPYRHRMEFVESQATPSTPSNVQTPLWEGSPESSPGRTDLMTPIVGSPPSSPGMENSPADHAGVCNPHDQPLRSETSSPGRRALSQRPTPRVVNSPSSPDQRRLGSRSPAPTTPRNRRSPAPVPHLDRGFPATSFRNRRSPVRRIPPDMSSPFPAVPRERPKKLPGSGPVSPVAQGHTEHAVEMALAAEEAASPAGAYCWTENGARWAQLISIFADGIRPVAGGRLTELQRQRLNRVHHRAILLAEEDGYITQAPFPTKMAECDAEVHDVRAGHDLQGSSSHADGPDGQLVVANHMLQDSTPRRSSVVFKAVEDQLLQDSPSRRSSVAIKAIVDHELHDAPSRRSSVTAANVSNCQLQDSPPRRSSMTTTGMLSEHHVHAARDASSSHSPAPSNTRFARLPSATAASFTDGQEDWSLHESTGVCELVGPPCVPKDGGFECTQLETWQLRNDEVVLARSVDQQPPNTEVAVHYSGDAPIHMVHSGGDQCPASKTSSCGAVVLARSVDQPPPSNEVAVHYSGDTPIHTVHSGGDQCPASKTSSCGAVVLARSVDQPPCGNEVAVHYGGDAPIHMVHSGGDRCPAPKTSSYGAVAFDLSPSSPLPWTGLDEERLRVLRFSELKELARQRGIDPHLVAAVDATDNPKGALIDILVGAPEEQCTLREGSCQGPLGYRVPFPPHDLRPQRLSPSRQPGFLASQLFGCDLDGDAPALREWAALVSAAPSDVLCVARDALFEVIGALSAENERLHQVVQSHNLAATRRVLDARNRALAMNDQMHHNAEEWFANIVRIIADLRLENSVLHALHLRALQAQPRPQQRDEAATRTVEQTMTELIHNLREENRELHRMLSPEVIDLPGPVTLHNFSPNGVVRFASPNGERSSPFLQGGVQPRERVEHISAFVGQRFL